MKQTYDSIICFKNIFFLLTNIWCMEDHWSMSHTADVICLKATSLKHESDSKTDIEWDRVIQSNKEQYRVLESDRDG